MTDFADSFKKGIAAAQLAERRKVEINAVFERLNAQLNEASNGIVGLRRQKFREKSLNMLLAPFGTEGKTHEGLGVYNRVHQGFGTKEVARWRQDPYGYPCWIEAGEENMACNDRESLERSLAYLLTMPAVGEVLLACVSFVPPSPTTPT